MPTDTWLPTFGGSVANISLLILPVLVLAMLVFGKTPAGYRVRLFGARRSLGVAAGARAWRVELLTMLVAGGAAGLAGWIQVAGVDRAVFQGTSWTAVPLLFLNAMAPERVAGLVLMGPLLPVAEPYDTPLLSGAHFHAPLAEYEGKERSNRAFMIERYEDYVDTWLRLCVAVLLSTLGGVGMWSYMVALPAIQSDFGIGRGEASLPFTLAMIGLACGGVLMGKLADRFGIVTGFYVLGAFALACALLIAVTRRWAFQAACVSYPAGAASPRARGCRARCRAAPRPAGAAPPRACRARPARDRVRRAHARGRG